MAVYDTPQARTSPAGGETLLLVTVSFDRGVTYVPAALTEGAAAAAGPLADLARPYLDQLHRALTRPCTAALPRPAASMRPRQEVA